MPGLLRGVARTAVVAGTATAVSNRVSRRQVGRWAAQEPAPQEPAYQQQPAYQQPAPQQPTPTPQQTGTDTNTKLAQLRELGELHQAGVLDDAEFTLQKARILDS